MPAEAEQQRVAIMGERSWLAWRAVCKDHGTDESGLIPNWMGKSREFWFDAKLDAAEHNATFHPRRHMRTPTWAQILEGPEIQDDTLLPNGRLRTPRHAGV